MELIAGLFLLVFTAIIYIISDYIDVQYEYPHAGGLQGWCEYWAYFKQEWYYWKRGDTRDDFENLTSRCSILNSSRTIHNASGGPA